MADRQDLREAFVTERGAPISSDPPGAEPAQRYAAPLQSPRYRPSLMRSPRKLSKSGV